MCANVAVPSGYQIVNDGLLFAPGLFRRRFTQAKGPNSQADWELAGACETTLTDGKQATLECVNTSGPCLIILKGNQQTRNLLLEFSGFDASPRVEGQHHGRNNQKNNANGQTNKGRRKVSCSHLSTLICSMLSC